LLDRANLAETEVNQKNAPVWCDLDVLRFDVAVDDGWILAVQVGQCITHLPQPGHDLRRGLAATRSQQVGQVYSFDEGHHEVLQALLRDEMIDHLR